MPPLEPAEARGAVLAAVLAAARAVARELALGVVRVLAAGRAAALGADPRAGDRGGARRRPGGLGEVLAATLR